MNIHPTSGGVAPLYSPANPSFLKVCMRQSTGPRKCDISVVCRRTFIVSNGWPTIFFISNPANVYCERVLGYVPDSFAMPLKTPPTKPR